MLRMICKWHLNTTFMQSSFILYAENTDGNRGGVERMNKVKLYSKSYENEEQMLFHLSYFLLIRSAEQGQVFGIAVQKSDDSGVIEEDAVEGLFEGKEEAEAEAFLFRLAEGLALPMELTALCDDYISEKESKNLNEMEQEAS